MEIVRENISFKRGQTPGQSLGVGIASRLKEITSDDLYEIILYAPDMVPDEDNFGQWYRDKPIAFKEDTDRIKENIRILQGHIEYGEKFDWKEHPEMKKHVDTNSNGRYVYNASPNMDDSYVVFSDAELPRAVEIEYNTFVLENIMKLNEEASY